MVQSIDQASSKQRPSFLVLVGGLLVAGSTLGNIWLVYQVILFQLNDGIAKAQADFELFMLTMIIGLPVAVLSLILLLVRALTNIKTASFVRGVRNPYVVVCIANLLVPLGLLAYLFSIKPA